jgi:toxin-antitoxin system PIN domain toxin
VILVDVNVLVYAFREDADEHARYRTWLHEATGGAEPYGVSALVLSGFLRVVTHPKVFRSPTPIATALKFTEAFMSRPNALSVAPGQRHWEIFLGFCAQPGIKGNLVPDAFHAALAVESGCEWISADRGFSRFRGLRWRHPLD